MGLWGAAQAIAFGLGGFLGAVASDLARMLLDAPGLAYGSSSRSRRCCSSSPPRSPPRWTRSTPRRGGKPAASAHAAAVASQETPA